MSKSKLEYIWLDGYKPTQNMRSKTKVENDFSGKLEDCPIWKQVEEFIANGKEVRND